MMTYERLHKLEVKMSFLRCRIWSLRLKCKKNHWAFSSVLHGNKQIHSVDLFRHDKTHSRYRISKQLDFEPSIENTETVYIRSMRRRNFRDFNLSLYILHVSQLYLISRLRYGSQKLSPDPSGICPACFIRIEMKRRKSYSSNVWIWSWEFQPPFDNRSR
jgi:hypothetical protein